MTKRHDHKLTILYIDDSTDPWLSNYLTDFVEKNKAYVNKLNFSLVYEECQFDSSISPQEFLNNDQIINADIFIIDSRLFENQTDIKQNKRYKGEELELLLRKVKPFSEVVVISQKEISSEQKNIVPKCSLRSNASLEEYKKHYDDNLRLIDKIESIIGMRTALREFLENDVWSVPLRRKIRECLNFIPSYDELSPSDIDRLVEAFKKIERQIDAH